MDKPANASELELSRKEAFNFALFQHHPAAMTVVDREGRVVKSNLARRALPVPLPDLGSELFSRAGGAEDGRLASELAACIASGEVRRLGEVAAGDRILELTISPFPDGAIVIVMDITERKRAEDEARARREELIRAQRLATIGTLVSGVAHEVSNPNNALLLSANALARLAPELIPDRSDSSGGEGEEGCARPAYGEMRAEALEQIEVIRRCAKRIQTTVSELKDYVRAEKSGMSDNVDLNAVMRGACEILAPVIRKATTRFTMLEDPDLPRVRGSRQRLEQVVVNMVSNACQALGGPDKAVSVRTVRDGAAGRAGIEVKDEGCGMTPETLARIRDPFFTTRHDAGGTGLGLSVSDNIVTAHGGCLDFQSRPGMGTAATMWLPAAVPAERKGET